MKNITVALVDDHVLLRNGLAGLVANLGYEVLFECSNGLELKQKLKVSPEPQIILMDINMPEMDGYAATLWVRDNYPKISVLALSMYDDEQAIIRMLHNGAKGYVMKDADPRDLKAAIDDVLRKGVHYSEIVTGRLLHSIYQVEEPDTTPPIHAPQLNEREIEFLKLASTELTYKEIAEKMHLSPRTIDGYRDILFEKLNTKNRVGLVLYAIRSGLVQVR
ncbi:MAG: response regulator transcription factor [Chitinophagaceae bacterium]|jgi:DNA-binding NarL/FixJ family response regulator|nr:response regulator transcription factor [Chitinophagaceae bacterium]